MKLNEIKINMDVFLPYSALSHPFESIQRLQQTYQLILNLNLK